MSLLKNGQEKMQELQKGSEEERLRAVVKLTFGIAIALTIISLAILLPLQIYITRNVIQRDATAKQQVLPQVNEVSDEE